MTYKLILVEATHRNHDCDGYCEPDIDSQEVSLYQLAQSQNWEIQREIISLLEKVLVHPDENALRILKAAGWVNIKDAQFQEENLVSLKEYLLLRQTSGSLVMPEYLDPSHINIGQANQLARGSQVVQVISKPSLKKLMDEKSLKTYNAASASIKKEAEKRKQANAAKEEKRRLKEIEKARKLLAEIVG